MFSPSIPMKPAGCPACQKLLGAKGDCCCHKPIGCWLRLRVIIVGVPIGLPLFVEPVSVDRSSIAPASGLRVGVVSRLQHGSDIARPGDRPRCPGTTTSKKVFLRTNVYPGTEAQLFATGLHSAKILDMGLSAITDICNAELE